MIMPYIEEQQTSADMISEFRGYNHNPVIGDNEFFDMENMTSDKYPMASTRDKRGVLQFPVSNSKILGIEGKDRPFILYKQGVIDVPEIGTGSTGTLENMQILEETGTRDTFFQETVVATSTSDPTEADAYLKICYSTDRTSSGIKVFSVADASHMRLNVQGCLFDSSNMSDPSTAEQIEDFVVGKSVYIATKGNNDSTDDLRTIPITVTGIEEDSGNYYLCFLKSELDEQEITNIERWQINDAAMRFGLWAPIYIYIKTSDLVGNPDDPDAEGYCAFYDTENQTVENPTSLGVLAAGEKQLVSMGANVIVFPDKKIINTLKVEDNQFTEIKNLENTFTSTTATVESNAPNAQSGSTLPTNPTDGQYFWDTSEEVAVLKQYSEAQGMWATKPSYLIISNISNHGFNANDAIKIDSDITSYIPNQKNFVIKKADTTSIRIQCALTGPVAEDNVSITLSRVLPEMDYIIESNNRLWGCHYGLNSDGEMVNEIFASKLGDPFNWFYFANTSIDSYYVSLGSEGAFTGAVNYQSTPTFFKADVIHRIVGDYPAQYQLKTIEGYGVKPGCHKSISVMNDVVYYLSPVGMVVFNGGIPISLAVPFGEVRYDKCISGDIGNKLYCSMHDEFDKWSMFVYDDSNGLWHREDNLRAVDFGTYNGELLCACENGLLSLGGVYGSKEPDFEWMIQTGDMGYMSPLRKTIRRVVLRIKLAITSRARIEIQYDNDGIWRHVNELRPSGRIRSYAVPVKPFRCDHYSIRIRGKGEFDLQSLTRHWAEGSELD